MLLMYVIEKLTVAQPPENINSSTLLAWLESRYAEGNHEKVNIELLATQLNIGIPALVSILTELEHRDEIKIEIASETDPASSELRYSGTVQLMRTPPDEETKE